MRAIEPLRHRWIAAGALAGIVALAAGCARGASDARVQATANGAPLVVGCAPNQQAIVRPVVLNGVNMSQVECVAPSTVPGTLAPAAMPVSYGAGQPFVQGQAYAPAAQEDARVVPVSYTRQAAPRRVTYEPRTERVVRSGRSWKKSAVIIGSSAGIGAGLGAALGGKKGALIGAALGGGSAAIWDQATRRR